MDTPLCFCASAMWSQRRRVRRNAYVFGAVTLVMIAAASTFGFAPSFLLGSAVHTHLRGSLGHTLAPHLLAGSASPTPGTFPGIGASKLAGSALLAAFLVSAHGDRRPNAGERGMVSRRRCSKVKRVHRECVGCRTGNGFDGGTDDHIPDAMGATSRVGRLRGWLGRAPRRNISRKELQKYGLGMVLSYGFVTNASSVFIIAAVWFLYTRQAGASPLTLRPLRLNPKFLAFYGAVYLSLGNAIRPLRFFAALGLAPAFDGLLNLLEERLQLPRWLSAGIMFGMLATFSVVMLLVAVSFAGFIAKISG